MRDDQPLAPVAVQAAADDNVEYEDQFITLPTPAGDAEVQIPQRPIYDALAQLSFTLCNGDGWAIGMPMIAWERLALGVDPYESYTYSTYEEVLVDLYVVAALCVPHGWWPVEVDDPQRPLVTNLEAWTFDEWNEHQRAAGYPAIDDPAASLKALAELIRNNPFASAQYEQKRTDGSWPDGAASPIS